jgi:aminoglycoside 3-N-acetyltransferase
MTSVTHASLMRDLCALGIQPGQILLVHSSLRGVGTGPAVLAAALASVLGPNGTIMVPTATADNSDTSPIHQERTQGMNTKERQRYRDGMSAYDPATTPSIGMGAFAEHIRTSQATQRSAHPQTSLAALGHAATYLVGGHAADCHYGENSPLAKLYKSDNAAILMLGVGYDSCTALHLAEYRYTPEPPTRRYNCVVQRDGRPVWWSYTDVVLDDQDFPDLGKALDRTPHVRTGLVGCANARLIPFRETIDFAVRWLAERRVTAGYL